MERYSDRAIEIINDLHTERLDYDSEYLPLIDCANRCKDYEFAEEQGLLFLSSEAVDEYREREELKMWVRMAADWGKIDRYTLAQLRAVKKILEESDHE